MTATNFLMLPLLTQAVVAIVLIFCWRRPAWQRPLSIAGSLLGVFTAVWLFVRVWNEGMLSMQAGNWSAPFGITMVADTLSALLVLITTFIGLMVSVYSTPVNVGQRVAFGYYAILHFLQMGLIGAFLAGDIFNMYVWFEIMIISSFVLLTIGGKKSQLDGAVKYFTLNMLASVIFLTAVAVLYGITGTLNMADMSVKLAQAESRGLVRISALIFLVGFGIKSAIFPLYFWLPAAYHTPPAPVSALFGGLLTKVGVYAMLRVFTLFYPGDPVLQNALIILAVITIAMGGIGALVQQHIQRTFSYLIICHIGYMVAGIGLGTPVAIAGVVFYMVHDMIVKTNLFLSGGLLYQLRGSYQMRDVGGVYGTHPWIALLMAIPLFSLVGIPPLSGFWPKISLIGASLTTGHGLVLAGIVLGSLLTLIVIARFWSGVFWRKDPQPERRASFAYLDEMPSGQRRALLMPVVILAAVSLYIGLGAGRVQHLSERIATELSNVDGYRSAILGTAKNLQP